ncbi:phosphatase PAP2 family protein [Aliiroseovarius marinus]|uniref:phosphatase PAP2 family protein n=1 Tax=Aliiroseovarius marinus TaxID=2500159 RepID=UPI003D7EC6CD
MFISVAAYAAFSILVIYLTRDNPTAVIGHAAGLIRDLVKDTVWMLLPYLSLAVLVIALKRQRDWAIRLGWAFVALALCSVFSLCFVMVKSSLPHIVPFWADPLLAELDRILHFGTDPWVFAHAMQGMIPNAFVFYFYQYIWLLPAIFLPALLILFDTDQSRIRRFVILWLFADIAIGNLLALAFMSGGPIFYGLIEGTDRFAPFISSARDMGLMDDWLAEFAGLLWSSHAQNALLPPGISAFPSVHLAMACLFALYAWERAPQTWPVAGLLLLMYQFFSVYIGWHYAIDGYVSILLMTGLWAILRRYSANQRKLSVSAPSNVAS